VPKRTWTVGNDVFFRLEIRNVGERDVALIIPQLMPTVSAPGDHPHGDDVFSCVITAQPIGQKINIGWARQALARLAEELAVLRRGATLRINIKCPLILRQEVATVLTEADRGRVIERKETLRFAYSGCPGRYLLVAEYSYPPRRTGVIQKVPKDVWQGSLKTPPIEVQVVK
jgi:hypothetical protein